MAKKIDPEYKAESIQVLEGIEAVRKRPGMYIGGTGLDGLHHLIWEVVNNSVDEALAGYAKNIIVKLEKGNRVVIVDDGRGIPVDLHPKTKKSALETILTYLHAGGKFSHKVYKVSGGLHGVGVSVVNALSKYLKAIVKRDGFEWSQEYKRGKPVIPLKKGRKTTETGTTIIFEPDPEIFPEISFERERILDYLKHQAYLTPGLRINFIDEREDYFAYSFYFEKGLQAFLKHLLLGRHPLFSDFFELNYKDEKVEINLIFTYLEHQETIEYFFTNNILNPEGGTHTIGFHNGLIKAFTKVGEELNIFKNKSISLTTEDVKGGIVAILSLKIPEPQFEGQTKAKLGNPEVRSLVESVLSEKLIEWLHKNPEKAKLILNRILTNVEARKAAKEAKEAVLKKRIQASLTLSGKLADCSSKNPEERELFIVEGESAGGSAKQGRDRRFQAVLPLKGKILNVEKAGLGKILKSEEIKNIILALGTGFGKDFNLEGLRYSKIIIACDADSDGNHIRTLLLTLFYRYFRPLVEKGYIYIAQPPLYKIQVGKEIYYAYNDAEKDALIKELSKSRKNVDVQRYKGLGEMNPEELWETTLNPEKRVLKQVTLKDAEEADRLFNILMGQDVEPRRKFIETYAPEVQNLDI